MIRGFFTAFAFASLFASVFTACDKDASTGSQPPQGEQPIPQVQGITVAYDTSKGIATVRWRKAGHPQLSDYLVYRDAGANAVPRNPSIGYTGDTVFSDTLWQAAPQPPGSPLGNLFRFEDSSRPAFTWRVRARLKNQDIGLFLNAASAVAMSPIWLRTATALELAGADGNRIDINQEARLILSFHNPSRNVKAIRWYDGDGSRPFRETAWDAREGRDTVIYRSGGAPSVSRYRIAVVDDGGVEKRDSISIEVMDIIPALALTASASLLHVGGTLGLTGKAQDAHRVVKWEWAIGQGGAFVPAAKPETTFQVEAYPGDATLPCALRATYDNGKIATAATEVQIVPWRKLRPIPEARNNMAVVAGNGKIYLIGGDVDETYHRCFNTVYAYDPATDAWEVKKPMRRARTGHAAVLYGSGILVAGGLDVNAKGIPETELYDFASGEWKDGPSLNTTRAFFGLAKYGSRVFAFEGRASENTTGGNPSLEILDSAGGAWTQETWPGMPARSHFSSALIDGKLHTFGGVTNDASLRIFSKDAWIYDLELGSASPAPQGRWSYSRATATRGGAVYMAGGDTYEPDGPPDAADHFEVLHPGSGNTRALSKIHPHRAGAALVFFEDKAYLLGGSARRSYTRYLDDVEVFTLSIDSVSAGL